MLLLVSNRYILAQEPETSLGRQLDVDIYGNIYILNPGRNTLKLFSKDRILKREVGGSGWENDQFDRPSGLWARNGIDVFVADYGNHRIQRFDRHLSYVSTLYTREDPNPDVRFGYPTDVAVSRLGDLFICDSEDSRIVKVNRFTQVERTFGGFGAGEGRLLNPTRVEIGPSDHVYVVDGARVVVFDNSGNFLHAMAGAFRPPVLLYANATSVVIIDSTSMYCLDTDERPVCSLPIQTVTGMERGRIQSIAFQQDSMYILSGQGVVALPDPPGMAYEK
jgi:hypothetical protein